MTKTTSYSIHIGIKNDPAKIVDKINCPTEADMISQLKRMVLNGTPIHAVNEIVITTTNIIEEVTSIEGWQLCYEFRAPGSTVLAKGHQSDLYDFRTGQGMLDTLCGVYGEGSHWLRPIVTEALSERCDVLDPQVNELPRKGFAKPATVDDEDDDFSDRYKGKRARGEPINTNPLKKQAVVTGLGISDRQRLLTYFNNRNFLTDTRVDRSENGRGLSNGRRTVILKMPQSFSEKDITILVGLALPNLTLGKHLSFETS